MVHDHDHAGVKRGVGGEKWAKCAEGGGETWSPPPPSCATVMW